MTNRIRNRDYYKSRDQSFLRHNTDHTDFLEKRLDFFFSHEGKMNTVYCCANFDRGAMQCNADPILADFLGQLCDGHAYTRIAKL